MNTIKENRIKNLIQPETTLERLILQAPELRKGLLWGKPRKGHPEGKVLYHVKEVLENVDRLTTSATMREQLRLITIIHDSFKYQEVIDFPRDWSKHHAVLARQFAEQYISDQAVLDVIEWHDDAYYCWRAFANHQSVELSGYCTNKLFKKLGENLELYFLFFKCDTQTGDKTQVPLRWFEDKVKKQLVF